MSYSAERPARPCGRTSAIADCSLANGSPVRTTAFQGWTLPPEGARWAPSRTRRSTAASTGCFRNDRIERRLVTASRTSIASVEASETDDFVKRQAGAIEVVHRRVGIAKADR